MGLWVVLLLVMWSCPCILSRPRVVQEVCFHIWLLIGCLCQILKASLCLILRLIFLQDLPSAIGILTGCSCLKLIGALSPADCLSLIKGCSTLLIVGMRL